MGNTEKGPALSPEMRDAMAQAAAAEAAIAGAGVATAGAGEAAATAPAEDRGGRLAKLKAENLDLLNMVLTMLEPALPFVRECYTPEACEKIAEAGARVEEKYGVSVGDLFGKFQPEIMLAVAVVVPSVAMVRRTREYVAERRAAAIKKDPPAAPPGGDVTPIKPGAGDGKKEGG